MRVFCCNPAKVEAEGGYFIATFPSGSSTVELVVTRHVLLHFINHASRVLVEADAAQTRPIRLRSEGRV